MLAVTGQLGATSFGTDDGQNVEMGLEATRLTDSEGLVPTIPVSHCLPTADAAGRIPGPNAVPWTWYSCRYVHGWSDANVPTIIRTVIAAVAARLTASPEAVTSERIGAGYGVTYSPRLLHG